MISTAAPSRHPTVIVAEFTDRVPLLDDLNERDCAALFSVMDTVLSQQRVKKVLEAATHEAAG